MSSATPASAKLTCTPFKIEANWGKDVSLLLSELITNHWRVTEGNQVTAHKRSEVWKDITRQINAAFPDTVWDKMDVE